MRQCKRSLLVEQNAMQALRLGHRGCVLQTSPDRRKRRM
jgi:ABC-type branched-subunit amino acid transport system ATPase component